VPLSPVPGFKTLIFPASSLVTEVQQLPGELGEPWEATLGMGDPILGERTLGLGRRACPSWKVRPTRLSDSETKYSPWGSVGHSWVSQAGVT
jgi:hypothetical protein